MRWLAEKIRERPPSAGFQYGGLASPGALMLSPRRTAMRAWRRSQPPFAATRSMQTCSTTNDEKERYTASGVPVVPLVASLVRRLDR